MIVKVIGAICVIGACTGGGMYCGKQLKLRQENLQYGRRTMELLQAQIRSETKNLPDALESTGRTLRGVYSQMCRDIAKRLYSYDGTTVQDIWEEMTHRYLKATYLKETDVEQFSAIGEQLGMTDRKRQEEILDRYITYVDGELETLKDDVKEKSKLYRNLGILLGIFLTILFL